MAVNKRKILETAQKFLQKGALDKALKEYKTLLEVDPRDSGARLKLGDIHLRRGEKDDAVAAYLKVAHQFMKDGFDAKAVALFKQIAKLAPELFEINVPLAELYQRLGLTSEAMAALQTATEGFQKAGRKREALELLRKAAALDPANTTSRLKIADLLRQQGMTAEALIEYDEVAAELERNGEEEALATVHERVLEIEPDRLTALLSLARVSLRMGENERAHGLAERAASLRPDLIEALELHAEALQAIGRADLETEGVFRRLAEMHRARGNEGRAREILQRFVPAYDLTQNSADGLGASVPAESFPGSDLLDDLTEAGAKLGPILATPPVDPLPVPSAKGATTPAVEAGVEQLLAEAGVYLRFGKRDKAISSLEAALAQSPNDLDALEKLADTCAYTNDVGRAVELLGRAVRAAEAQTDEARAAQFRARMIELGSESTDAPEGIQAGEEEREGVAEIEPGVESATAEPQLEIAEPGPQAIADAAPLEEPAFEFEVELDLSAGGELEAPVELAEADTDDAQASSGPLIPEFEFGPDPELSEALELVTPEERETTLTRSVAESSQLALAADQEPAARELEPEPESEIALESEIAVEAPFVEEVVPEPSAARTQPSIVSPKQILEDLEEADFYFQQNLLVEAEAVYRRVLETAPTNPQALLRLGEIGAARGDDPGAERPTLELEPAIDDVTQPGFAAPSEADRALGDDLAHWDEEAQQAAQTDDTCALEGALEAPEDRADTHEISQFDLAAELSDALDVDDTAARSRPSVAPEAEPSFDTIFSEFKRGVQKTLTAADHETHYDLGIAYREMGLLEDAMGEFQVALESPARRIDCLHLLGLCARELKRGSDAVAFFRQALADPELSAEHRASIGFDLGIALEESGDVAAALAALGEVAALVPGFPRLEERIHALRALLRLTPSADGAAEPVAAAAEVYESFDDLIADAEAAFAADGSASEPPPDGDETLALPPAPPSKPAAGEPPPTPPRGTSPRRRKTSFG